MESCNRTKSTDRTWLYLLAAVLGTLALAFVPSDAWLGGMTQPAELLLASFAKQLLTVMLLLIVPSVTARLAHRISPWVILGLFAFAFGAGLLVTGDPKDALYTTALCALPGAGLYGLQRLKLSNFRTVIYASFLNLAALFAFVCLRDLIRSGDAYASYKQLVAAYGEVMNRLAGSADPTGELGLGTESDAIVRMLRVNAEAYCTAILLIPAMAAGLSNVLFSHLWNRHGGADLVKLPPFSEWRCERGYAVFAAAFLLATMLLGMFGWHTADALSGIAGVMWRMPCMLGGLCALRRLGVRYKRMWIFWVSIALLITLPPAASVMLTLLGFLSALRKPMNAGEDGERI